MSKRRTCESCEGSGQVAEDHGPGLIEHLGCQDCMGTGLVPLNDPLLEDVIAQRDHAEALAHRYLTERDKALGVVEAVRGALTDCDLTQPATNSKSRREWCIAHQQWTPCAYADLASAIAAYDASLPTEESK